MPDRHIYHCDTGWWRPDVGKRTTYLQIASMTLWHGELLMKRLALLMMASSMALPTVSSMSSSRSCLAFSRIPASHPMKTGQLVVIAKARSSKLSAYTRMVRIANISHKMALDRDKDTVARF